MIDRLTADHHTAVVIGGGPAGLIAAERLANAGHHVTVYEQRRSVGRKFLLAGRGGLNITHGEPFATFITRYGDRAGRLQPLLERFGPAELRAWCEGLGQPTFEGSSGRVFPETFRATPLLRAWLQRLAALDVRIETSHAWIGWSDSGAPRIVDPEGVEVDVAPDVMIIALGGASWPRVGSDGRWASVFEAASIEVRPLRPANVGVRLAWSGSFAERFAGAPLKNVSVTVGASTVRGDPIVTTTGLEGGPIYALGVELRDALDDQGSASLVIDLHPDQTFERLTARLARRRPKDSAATWLRRSVGLQPAAIGVMREATGNALPVDAATMAALVKAVPLTVTGTMPVGRAISTAGGVSFDELDDALMLRRRPGVFVAGEMLDWEAPTGGYLLQASFATGVAAAEGAIAWLASTST